MLFCLPFAIGFLVFFLTPLIESARYAFSSVSLSENGIILRFVGLKNFREALFADPYYIRTIVESLGMLAVRTPGILLFSVFSAIMLNQGFRGRTFFRAVFFLPVIVVSGVVLEILQADYLSSSIIASGSGVSAPPQSSAILEAVGVSGNLAKVMKPLADDIFNLAWGSGVQMLMFLAGLQTVPQSMHECAIIEGATAWERFWKITFPLVSPVVLMIIVYTFADFFTTSANPVIKMISQQSSNMRFEYASGLSWMHMILALLLLGLVYRAVDRHVVYVEE
jgi:ABC-type sugar transport system permease subunit